MLMLERIIIREALPEDAPAFQKHMLKIYAEPDVDTPYTPEEYKRTADQEADRIRMFQMMDNSLFLVAMNDEEMVGSMRLLGGMLHAVRHNADLALYVDEAYRGYGLGQELLQRGIAWARNSGILTRIQLEVYTRNKRAIHLYKKFGFEVEGKRNHIFFQDGIYLDEYIMALLF